MSDTILEIDEKMPLTISEIDDEMDMYYPGDFLNVLQIAPSTQLTPTLVHTHYNSLMSNLNYENISNTQRELFQHMYTRALSALLVHMNTYNEDDNDDNNENDNLETMDDLTPATTDVTNIGDSDDIIINTHDVSVARGDINPLLKQTISRFISLDSQFRPFVVSHENICSVPNVPVTTVFDSISTDYTFTLHEQQKNVLSIRVYSYQIPYTWYTFDEAYTNICMWITSPYTSSTATSPDAVSHIRVSISPGNYTADEFVAELNHAFTLSGFTTSTVPLVTYRTSTGKLSFNLSGANYAGGTAHIEYNTGVEGGEVQIAPFTVQPDVSFMTFYGLGAGLQCTPHNCKSGVSASYLNQTLGWNMGFRAASEPILSIGNTAPAVLDLGGPKSLMLVIDDFNQNHLNGNIVSIAQTNTNAPAMPSYYSLNSTHTCPASDPTNPYITNTISDGSYVAPRLTAAQLHTINEISWARSVRIQTLAPSPTQSDLLAIIPIKSSGVKMGSVLVEFSGALQDCQRMYFGPVNISRMRVRLLDDHGRVLNLNGANWNVTLIATCLYQL